MIGAGAFSRFGAVIAFCNATASEHLAVPYPVSGDTYIYGRARLGPWWGFTAGCGFRVGISASCAAMASTVAEHALPGAAWAQRVIAVAAVIGPPFGPPESTIRKPETPPKGLTAIRGMGDTCIVSGGDDTREVESLVDRLSAEFPDVPADSVHQVALAAWAEVAHNPVRDVVPDLAEHVAQDSLKHYPVSPGIDGDGAG